LEPLSIYDITDAVLAGEFVDQLGADLQDESCPPEVRSLGRTIVRWRDQIVAWHQALVSNGPTEALRPLTVERLFRLDARHPTMVAGFEVAGDGAGRNELPGVSTVTVLAQHLNEKRINVEV